MAGKGGVRPNSGRKPKDEENRIRDLMMPYSIDAIQCLANIIINEENKTADRISASKIVIEYCYGKPKDSIDLTTQGEKLQTIIQLGSGIKPNGATN
tara:strand:+ start:889 stop:1179 length:291 start_codon:yes stop_codon:yes gene_type:complete